MLIGLKKKGMDFELHFMDFWGEDCKYMYSETPIEQTPKIADNSTFIYDHFELLVRKRSKNSRQSKKADI